MWADRKGWASRAPLSRLQLLGAAGTAEGWKHTHGGRLLLEPACGSSPSYGVWLLQVCTKSLVHVGVARRPLGQETLASKTPWTLGGSGQGQKPLKMATE